MSKIDDLIALSGVSRSTVFRFLRGDNVRPAAKNTILNAMQALDMKPEERTLPRGSLFQISIRPDFKDFRGYGVSMAAFMSRAESKGYQVQLKTGTIAGAKSDVPPAGVLILGKNIRDEELEIDTLRNQGIPHVLINRVIDDSKVSWVSIDHRRATKDAVSYLVDMGHTDIGTWGVASYRVDKSKIEAFHEAFAERGLPEPRVCLEEGVHGTLEAAVQTLVDQRRLPTAWFAMCDEHAMRFIRVARDNGIRIPEDVAIVGMDDVESSGYFSPSLTSVHVPYQAAGACAADVLIRLIEDPNESAVHILLKHHLVQRESCGSLLRAEESSAN